MGRLYSIAKLAFYVQNTLEAIMKTINKTSEDNNKLLFTYSTNENGIFIGFKYISTRVGLGKDEGWQTLTSLFYCGKWSFQCLNKTITVQIKP
jgi:hypothetical protein